MPFLPPARAPPCAAGVPEEPRGSSGVGHACSRRQAHSALATIRDPLVAPLPSWQMSLPASQDHRLTGTSDPIFPYLR